MENPNPLAYPKVLYDLSLIIFVLYVIEPSLFMLT